MPKFGMTTFKTDNQQEQLTTQLTEFRHNPFASLADAEPAAVVADDDLTRVEESPQKKSGRFGARAAAASDEDYDLEEMKRIEKILKRE